MTFNKFPVFRFVVFSLVFLPVALIFFANCARGGDWVEFRGVGGRGVSATRISPPLGVRWMIRLQEEGRRLDSFNPPVVIGNTIYFGSGDGNFYALDVESGFMRWVFRSGGEINSIPYADDRHVYFGSRDGRLYALSRSDGREMWSFLTNSQINSQVRRYGDYIIFVADADAIYFLSPDGEEQFRINNPGWMNFTFFVDNGVMYFATGPRVLDVGPFDIQRREFLWFIPFHEIDYIWYSVAGIRNDLVFFGTADIRRGTELGFYALNRATGEIVWSVSLDGVFPDPNWGRFEEWDFFWRNIEMLDFMAPTIWRNLVIFTGGDSVARAFDANTGTLRWEKAFDMPIASSSTIAGNRLYFGIYGYGDTPPRLVCLDARTGRLLWYMETEGSLLSSPVIAGRRIIFGTDQSVFYVLEEVL
ncbi:MAG: PQQ-binding-like beta-propeller repeat protein [Treponema sp.]|nr:PQQ-binding-like beta-propeller repeat protein [Treponema sp.]